jgi:hypothetical protein
MALSFVIPRVESRMILPDGTMSRDWYMFLSALLQTVGGDDVVPGGGIAPIDVQRQYEEYAVTSIEAVEALRGVEELRNADMRGIDGRVQEMRGQIEDLQQEIAKSLNQFNQLREQIEDLASRVPEPSTDELRNRVETIEARLA